MIRFVSFRSPTRGSPARSSDPARRRDPSSITATVASPSARASARRRVAPARDRRCATREKPKNRKIEKTKTNLDRADLEGVRGSSKPYALFPHTTQKPVGRTPSRVARRRRATRKPARARDVERRGRSAGAGDGTRRGGASTTTRASDRRARGSARTARAGERRARDEGKTRDRGRGGRRATTEGEGRDGSGRPDDDDDDANDGIAMMGTDGARRANRAGFGAGADGERGGLGGAFEGDARARGGEGDEITARSMRLTTMRARWWMFGFTGEDDAV